MEFTNARILITGGSSGLGKATARLLIERGARVAITGRDRSKLEHVAAELGAWPLHYDASKESDILAMYAEIDREWGGLDVLVNNAGIGFFGPVDEVSWSDFEKIFHTNVFGAAIVGREAARRMKAQNKGNIINIASSAGVRGFKNGTVYAASKFAVRGMTECWRDELRPHNIRVMLVNPSAVPTAFNVESREEKPLKDNMLRPEELAHAMVSALAMDDRGFIPELGVWATNPF
ncbi:MAG: SDR family oxidoreductase [Bacteroidota bacterium]